MAPLGPSKAPLVLCVHTVFPKRHATFKMLCFFLGRVYYNAFHQYHEYSQIGTNQKLHDLEMENSFYCFQFVTGFIFVVMATAGNKFNIAFTDD